MKKLNPAQELHDLLHGLRSAGLSLEDMARGIGCSSSTIKKYLKVRKARTISGRILTAARELHERVVERREPLNRVLPQKDVPTLPESARDAFEDVAVWEGASDYDALTAALRARVDAEYEVCRANIEANLAAMRLALLRIAEEA